MVLAPHNSPAEHHSPPPLASSPHTPRRSWGDTADTGRAARRERTARPSPFTDASVAGGKVGTGYLATTGETGLRAHAYPQYLTAPRVRVVVTELRAVYWGLRRILAAHPGRPVEVRVDNLDALDLLHEWQRGGYWMPDGYETRLRSQGRTHSLVKLQMYAEYTPDLTFVQRKFVRCPPPSSSSPLPRPRPSKRTGPRPRIRPPRPPSSGSGRPGTAGGTTTGKAGWRPGEEVRRGAARGVGGMRLSGLGGAEPLTSHDRESLTGSSRRAAEPDGQSAVPAGATHSWAWPVSLAICS